MPLCGDFNEPRAETATELTSWAKHNRFAKKDPERWKGAVESVLLGLAAFDLHDVFRQLHPKDIGTLWSVRVAGRARRYDHVLASRALRAKTAEYLHEVDALGLSDHTPVLVDFDPTP